MDDILPIQQREKIASKLKELGALQPCSRCTHKDFELLDGYFAETIQKDFDQFALGGQVIPMTVVMCKRCGFMNHHALGILGLLPSSDEGGTEGQKNGK